MKFEDELRITNKLIDEYVRDILHPKPYLVCICNNFQEGERIVDRNLIKCKNCGGLMSYEKIKKKIKGCE